MAEKDLKEWITTKEFAEVLGMTENNFNVWKRDSFGKLDRRSVREDPQNKRRNVWSPEFVAKKVEERKSVATRERKRPVMVVEVKIPDEAMSAFFLKKFASKQGLAKHLQTYLAELYKPKRDKLAALEAEFEAKKRKILSSKT